jgi:hypothetical protein
VPLGTDVSAADQERFRQMRKVWAEADIIVALQAWWASPHITRGRHVSFFQTDAPEVIAHVKAGHSYAFRDPRPQVTDVPLVGIKGKTDGNAAALAAFVRGDIR